MGNKFILPLDDDHQILENAFGAFIQKRRRGGRRYADGPAKPVWRTLSMHQGLEEAIQAWGVLATPQTAAGDPSKPQERAS